MPRPDSDALARSLSAMTVGLIQRRESDERESAPLRLDETDQVFQVAIEGDATEAIEEWVEFDVNFDYSFVFAPSQRSVQFRTPQFTWGFELTSRGDPVVVYCVLAGWASDDPDPMITRRVTTTGATLRVGAFIPAHDGEPVPYKGLLHLNFGGFAAPTNTPSDEDAI